MTLAVWMVLKIYISIDSDYIVVKKRGLFRSVVRICNKLSFARLNHMDRSSEFTFSTLRSSFHCYRSHYDDSELCYIFFQLFVSSSFRKSLAQFGCERRRHFLCIVQLERQCMYVCLIGYSHSNTSTGQSTRPIQTIVGPIESCVDHIPTW